MSDNFDQWRLGIFLGTFCIMALIELLLPGRDSHPAKPKRWFSNLVMALIDSLALRFALPLVAIGAASIAFETHFGLAYWLNIPLWLSIPLTILLLDALIWLQHLLSHKIPLLWRLHRVHHSDVDMDITTALRFHPFEILLSMLYKIAFVFLLGAPVFGVFLYEVILNAMAMFNHANLRFPERLDRVLRWLIVTPDMHRIHHSVYQPETDSNYGNFLSWWDKLWGTYVLAPRDGQDQMRLGLNNRPDDKPTSLLWALLSPLIRK